MPISENKERASRAGKARASSLSPEQRKAISSQAAKEKWKSAAPNKDIPLAEYTGKLQIRDIELPCAVLPDRTRVVMQSSIAKQLGRGHGGKTRKLAAPDGGPPMPMFLSGATLEPFVSNSLRLALSEPIVYRARGGQRKGVDATLLPEICDVWLTARDAGVLQRQQIPIAENADILMRALARVGITALVDEATGYQYIRDRDELHKILEAYISKELLPWAKRFPDEFYKELFRLRNWQYSPVSVKRPRHVGRLTADLVYKKLPEGVLDELRQRNPTVADDGRRRYRHHQFLSETIGHPHLEKHIASVTTLMRASPNWDAFKRLFDRAFPFSERQEELPGILEECDS